MYIFLPPLLYLVFLLHFDSLNSLNLFCYTFCFITKLTLAHRNCCAFSSFYIVTLSYISYIITQMYCMQCHQVAHSRLIAPFLLHCLRLTNCIVVSILPCRLFLTYSHSYILYLVVLGRKQIRWSRNV